jgi:hypothetical protein
MLKALRASKILIATTALVATVALVGTSFAWFTSSADNTGNPVALGVLTVTQSLQPEDLGAYQPGETIPVTGSIFTEDSTINPMIRLKLSDLQVALSPDKGATYGAFGPADLNKIYPEFDDTQLGFADLDINGNLIQYDPITGAPNAPIAFSYMWFTDPLDPTAAYCVADPGIPERDDAAGNIINDGIQVLGGDIAINGKATGNDYQAAKISLNSAVFATQALDGATSDDTVWPGQTWGVSLVSSSATVHQLSPCFNDLNALAPSPSPVAGVAAVAPVNNRGAQILAHFQAVALGK